MSGPGRRRRPRARLAAVLAVVAGAAALGACGVPVQGHASVVPDLALPSGLRPTTTTTAPAGSTTTSTTSPPGPGVGSSP